MCCFKPDVFLFSIVLFLGAFLIAITLKKFRESGFLSSRLRNAVADLNVSLAVLIMTLISIYVNLDVPKLHVPMEFKPTMDRPWVINPLKVHNWYEVGAALLPAVFFTILVFMDQQITTVIVNRKDNRLKKGFGYHLDMFVMSILMVICATLGIPFYVAATIISIMHVESLKQMTEITAPGEKPSFIGINEQRVSAITAHVLVGLTVVAAPALKFVPLPVLAGIFLYMGLVVLVDQQFFNRILLFFMPTKYQPDYSWLRVVHMKKVHLFTIIQIISLVLMFVVKHSRPVSMVFPFMLIVMVVTRLVVMEKIFTKKELHALDDLVPTLREMFTRKMPRSTKIRIDESKSL